MKQLMFDYWRRKSIVLISGAIIEFVMGMLAAVHHDRHPYLLAPFQMQIGIFLGPFLLSLDLQRGLARTVCALPVTTRQMGRAWWFATVGIPSAVGTALMFAGAAAMSLLKLNAVIDWTWLVIASTVLFLWMGSTFTMIFITGYGLGSGWKRLGNILGGALWGLMVGGGMWFSGSVSESSTRAVCAMILGVALTGTGWFMSERLVMGRASFRLGSQTGGKRSRTTHPQKGYGAIPLLLTSTLTRALTYGIAMILIMSLIFFLQGGPHYDWTGAVKAMLSMGFFPFWFMIFVVFTPALLQLRLLRSLPISTTSLAAAMIGMATLPLITLGGLIAVAVGATLGAQTVVGFAGTYLLTIPLSSLFVVLVIWLGSGTSAFVSMMLLIIAMQSIPVFFNAHERIPLAGETGIAAAAVLICFWAARCGLLRGSKAYRPQPNLFGAQSWWQTR